MENNNQIQMAATSQIQAQMINHWKEDLHSRWPRTSGHEERQRWFCNLRITQEVSISVGRNQNVLTKNQKMHYVYQYVVQRMATEKKCPP